MDRWLDPVNANIFIGVKITSTSSANIDGLKIKIVISRLTFTARRRVVVTWRFARYIIEERHSDVM